MCDKIVAEAQTEHKLPENVGNRYFRNVITTAYIYKHEPNWHQLGCFSHSSVSLLPIYATAFNELCTLFVVMKCYIYSKFVLQLIAFPRAEYPINRFI
jgi:hypothetical protein